MFRRYWPVLAVLVTACGVLVFHLNAERFSRPENNYPTDNYSSIEEGFFLGGTLSKPPPGTRAVLNVCATEDPYTAEVHRWDPIPDVAPAPSLDWLRRQVGFIDEQRRAGRPTYVHCAAGISRSVMVATAYFMWRDGISRDDALALIRARRPWIGPNRAFMGLLLEYEKSLRKPTAAP